MSGESPVITREPQVAVPEAPGPPGPEIPGGGGPRRRRTMFLAAAIGIVLLAAGLAVFLLTRAPETEAPAQGAKAEKAAPVEPAAPTGPAIELAAGTIHVGEAEIADTFPPGCEATTDPSCQVAAPGYEILVVWFEPNGTDPAAASDEIIDVYGDVSVTDATGERTEAFGGGMMDERLMVMFTPAEGSAGLTLHWPGADPIPLDV